MKHFDYKKYSIEELEEVISTIDKSKHKTRYEQAVSLLNLKRKERLLATTSLPDSGETKGFVDLNRSRSVTRVIVLLLAGLAIALLMTLGSEPTPLKDPFDLILAAILIFITGLPLVLSIASGKTLSRAGIININDSFYYFTMMQIAWSVLFWIAIVKTILRMIA